MDHLVLSGKQVKHSDVADAQANAWEAQGVARCWQDTMNCYAPPTYIQTYTQETWITNTVSWSSARDGLTMRIAAVALALFCGAALQMTGSVLITCGRIMSCNDDNVDTIVDCGMRAK